MLGVLFVVLAWSVLGRSGRGGLPGVPVQHYIEPDETVNPVTAEILEALAPKGGQAHSG